MKDISKRIKDLREERGITQSALAEKLCVTRQAVSNWETQKTRPDIEMLEKMADVFEIEITELLYGAEKRRANKKYILCIAIFLAAIVLAIILNVFAVPAAREMYKHGLSSYILFFLAAVIKLCFYGLIIPLILSVISIWADVYIKSKLIRKILLGAGIVILAVYVYGAFGTAFNVFCGENGLFWLPEWVARSSYAVYMSFSRYSYVPLVCGALFYFGINKKAAI